MASRAPTAPRQAAAATTTSGTSSSPASFDSKGNSNSNSNNNNNKEDDEVTGAEEEEDEEADTDIPLTMAASVVLADLPSSAAMALERTAAATGPQPAAKVVVRFKPVGAAPRLAQDVCKISATRRFEEVVRYLRRKLRCAETDSVFLYVNSAFAPSLDEVVGNLHQCFKSGQDQLVVAYSMTPAFG
ncbi:ubiquitin-like autophagy protein Apg12 [Beauveria bassiana ARSEF 2860]|uniref:Ubiquitin-like protein ATG12 n=1 Tax=Beauveria bassiana (strain ARSEF 2860) TaxID=655819 RepID=J5JNX3_BEAB2|nr:ubiquitin-like autophagy protein Apg12 [Beauveria bassiana ARSEF 2860]EJP64666.1 ubiquitin-like autophagy protein Apg12 [Beauveria bassiana ARSEF 2860]